MREDHIFVVTRRQENQRPGMRGFRIALCQIRILSGDPVVRFRGFARGQSTKERQKQKGGFRQACARYVAANVEYINGFSANMSLTSFQPRSLAEDSKTIAALRKMCLNSAYMVQTPLEF